MSYAKRLDGRKFDELREMKAKAGIINRADGSAYFQCGDTIAYVAVYGPRNLHPKFLQNPKKGILRCHYNMMPFSGCGERIRPGGNRRSKEISMIMKNALLPILDLSEFPNAVIDVFVELPQTDAGTRCAAICAASIALADAGITMKELVSSVAMGKVGDKIVTDMTYDEESYDEHVVDIPFAVLPRTGEISLMQMDGILSKDDLKEAVEGAKQACKKIYEVQKQALKEKFNRGGKDE